jgi:hypothetical protein
MSQSDLERGFAMALEMGAKHVEDWLDGQPGNVGSSLPAELRALKLPSPLPVDGAAEARYEALLAEKHAGAARKPLVCRECGERAFVVGSILNGLCPDCGGTGKER